MLGPTSYSFLHTKCKKRNAKLKSCTGKCVTDDFKIIYLATGITTQNSITTNNNAVFCLLCHN